AFVKKAVGVPEFQAVGVEDGPGGNGIGHVRENDSVGAGEIGGKDTTKGGLAVVLNPDFLIRSRTGNGGIVHRNASRGECARGHADVFGNGDSGVAIVAQRAITERKWSGG